MAASAGTFENGNNLLAYCKASAGTWESSYCLGFIAGVADTNSALLCVPNGVTLRQLADVVAKNLEKHPEARHFPAYDLTTAAILTDFPCR